MNSRHLDRMKAWFSTYVARFYTGDPEYNRAIEMKEIHTGNVCRNIVQIAEALGLSDAETVLAETAALFHDLGRFRQYAVYGTFRDAESENHARLSIREMALNRVPAGWPLTERRRIVRAIAFHNAACLPDSEDDGTLRLMRMLRDADKLDIWRVFSDYYENRGKTPFTALEIGLADRPECSPAVLESLRQGHPVRLSDMETLNDMKLLQLSWVFDLNFSASFRLAAAKRYTERIGATLPASGEIAKALEPVRAHFDAALRGSADGRIIHKVCA
ncbi:HD family phosphohydrolase [Desulfonema ishimotonii]|uniref:HD family phosphohydrolase n=1 Tax=Desulfonema ishimotonii TaxID=45657 RepID=A0A401FW45_9BACT|nr:HD domain-containing protein [Desulfonema ishimotonii]GBC61190.1 HD family phosphohydrolase [Desulfonema ishimotonii]